MLVVFPVVVGVAALALPPAADDAIGYVLSTENRCSSVRLLSAATKVLPGRRYYMHFSSLDRLLQYSLVL